MTTSQIETENTQMTNDLYRLLKKYTGLRNLIRELKVNNSLNALNSLCFMHEDVRPSKKEMEYCADNGIA